MLKIQIKLLLNTSSVTTLLEIRCKNLLLNLNKPDRIITSMFI